MRLLQLALRSIECVAKHDVHVVVAIALWTLHVDDDILARHGELHLDGEDLALVVCRCGESSTTRQPWMRSLNCRDDP